MEKNKVINTGVIDDPRTEDEKARDYKHHEIASGEKKIFVNWEEKKREDWNIYEKRVQNGSGSCVAQALAKMLGINNFFEEGDFISLSAKDIYTKRSNDGAGMWGVDALQIVKQTGATLEDMMPSQGMTEDEINEVERKIYQVQIGKIFKPKNFIILDFNIDRIGEQIQKNRPVLMFLSFNKNEWTDAPQKKTEQNTGLEIHHAVVGVDTTIYKGEKAIIIDDSWGEFEELDGQRIITESFMKGRMSFCAYLIDLHNDWRENEDKDLKEKPKHEFTKGMKYSDTFNVDEEVKWLQKILIYENLFPMNVDVTGYYGSITRKAVLEFQLKHEVDKESVLKELDGKFVGPKTLEKLNELY